MAIQTLKPKYKGRDLFSYHVKSAGVTYGLLMERIQAARWAGYTPTEFFKLDSDWMAMIIAAYRTDRRTEAVLNDEQNKKIKRRQKSGSSRPSGRRPRS